MTAFKEAALKCNPSLIPRGCPGCVGERGVCCWQGREIMLDNAVLIYLQSTLLLDFTEGAISDKQFSPVMVLPPSGFNCPVLLATSTG